MLGKVPSLNVSVAAAVVLYEIVRQRRAREGSSVSETDAKTRTKPSAK
jgi:tRNA C32,U32 (ribose-2'-O)-methylase TrmJ